MEKPKVALVHDYLVQYGGAEKTLEAVAELFPEAPIYTGIYNPKSLSKALQQRKVIAGDNSLIRKFPKHLTFLMPYVFEHFDLRDYDLIISDGTAWPKGVLTTPSQLHISYIHTPPRFLYGYSVENPQRFKWYYKPAITVIDHFLRIWDYNAAQRPDYLVANSFEIQRRIKKYYARDATVIYPPVESNFKAPTTKNPLQKPYYITVGRLAAYKNTDLLISAFNCLGLPLVIVGTGREEKKLRSIAQNNITFTGKVSESEKHELLANSHGFIFPVEDEDFGIVPIEAMAHGKPVLAHRSGGPLETIEEGKHGEFFDTLTEECLIKAIKNFDANIRANKYNAEAIRVHAQQYSKEGFQQEFSKFVEEKWEEHARVTRGPDNSNCSQ